MQTQRYLQQVESDIAESEAFLRKRRGQEKRRAFYSSISMAIAAAVTTFAVGLGAARPNLSEITTVVALGAGAIATVLGAFESHWDHRGLWAHRTQILFLLQQLRRSIASYKSQLDPSANPDEAAIRQFEKRHERIRELDMKGWSQLRKVDLPQFDEPDS